MIVPYTVYNKISGKILRTGSAPVDMVDLQANENEAVVIGKSNDECDWVHPGSRTIKYEHIMTIFELQAKKDKETQEMSAVARREALLQDKMREMAIRELEKEGKL